MLNQIQIYLGKLFTILLNKYPLSYKAMDYIFTILAVFHSYLYIIGYMLHNRFKNNFPIIYSITVYIYSEYLFIINGNISSNIRVIISLYVLCDLSWRNILLFGVLLLNNTFKQHLIKEVWIRSNYPISYRVLLDISSIINTILTCYFLDCIFIIFIKPFILNLWNGLLKMTDNEDNHNNASGSDSDKTPGKNPKGPKNSSEPEYYTNKHGKRVKRDKRNEAQKKEKNAREKEVYKMKEEAEDWQIINQETLVGLTEEERKEHYYNKKRKTILSKREEDFKESPIIKGSTKRRKNNKMTPQEIIPEENLLEEIIPEENLPEQTLDKGKGKAKSNEFIENLSGSEYSAGELSDSSFEKRMNRAKQESRYNYSNKKGESSKGSK